MNRTESNPSLVPTVSIGLPVFNGGAYLRESIDSLLSQTFHDLELVISDNASVDGTETICREIAARDARVRYTRLPTNIGGVGNHRRVARLARSKYFMWASSDDIWRPTYVERCVEILERDTTVVVAYAVNAQMDESGKALRTLPLSPELDVDDPLARFCWLTQIDNTIEPAYGLIRSATLARSRTLVGHPGSDRILFAELGLFGRMRQIPEPLYVRRIHGGQSVAKHFGLKERYRWINPDHPRRLVWPHLEYALHFAGAALRSAPSMAVRVGCLVHIAKWCLWHSAELWTDVVGTAAKEGTG